MEVLWLKPEAAWRGWADLECEGVGVLVLHHPQASATRGVSVTSARCCSLSSFSKGSKILIRLLCCEAPVPLRSWQVSMAKYLMETWWLNKEKMYILGDAACWMPVLKQHKVHVVLASCLALLPLAAWGSLPCCSAVLAPGVAVLAKRKTAGE